MKVRTQARRDNILDIARRVFLECGYERTSMTEIARQVGGSKGTLYGYFPSKEALFVAATQAEGYRLMGPMKSELERLGHDDLRKALLATASALVHYFSLEATISAYRMVLAESGRSDIGQLFYEQGAQEGIQMLSKVLKSAMLRGELRSADSHVAALHFHSLVSGEVQVRWFYRETETWSAARCRAAAKRAVEVFLRGYAPE